jgi:hypothetical protein
MDNLRKVMKSILLVAYIARKINWVKFIRSYDSKSKNVVLLSFLAGRFGNELVCWDFSYISALIKAGKRFRISSKLKGHEGCTIYWSPSQSMVSKDVANYAKDLIKMAVEAEGNGNRIIPSSYEIQFLENKTFMYEYFVANGIRTPQTRIFDSLEELEKADLKFPILLKGEHSSGSHDIHKFDSRRQLDEFIASSDYLKKFDHIILQQLLDIKKDLRVTIVGEEVVLYYWRINPSDEWKPTASSFGGTILFDEYPQMWHSYIIENFKKTNMKMGAFDVTWDHDDLSTEPYFLEISPRFSPNPPTKLDGSITYGKWKKRNFGPNVYYKAQADLIFRINELYTNSYN